MRALTITVALLLAACSKGNQDCEILLPPPLYDHPPTGRVTIIDVPWNYIPEMCAKIDAPLDQMGKIKNLQACSRWGMAVFGDYILAPPPDGIRVTYDEWARLIRHEMGHAATLKADHVGWVCK